ncbi:MAG: hypothetical protein JZU65_20710 [Chlorobium sp.]|nr:hypothetical protein [Chlorobium sp.]
MEAASIIVPAQMVYMKIPAKELRGFTDGIFPALAVNPIADSAKGFGHRYVAGHDLFWDVPKTLTSHGPREGLRHAGHVVLTDFPTKAGIPFPLLSHSGLGQFLEQAGIHRGWLQISLFDSGIGIYAIAEGSTDLAQAIHGTLVMNWGTFFDTFVEGGIEVGLAIATKNPLLLFGGVENILAGVVATWNKMTVYINPLDFFGSAGVSALVGFGLAYGLADENLSDAGVDAIRSGAVGALFSISPAFGFGALAGFSAYRLGCGLAEIHNGSQEGCLSIDRQSYILLVEEICKGNPNVKCLLERALPCLVIQEQVNNLPTRRRILSESCKILSADFVMLHDKSPTLNVETTLLKVDVIGLPDDLKVLAEWYQEVLAD